MHARHKRALWTVAAVAALLAPARSGTFLDGIPLDQPLDAMLIGLLVPVLVLLDRQVFDRRWARALVVAMAAVKIGGYALLTVNGLCTEFRADRPVLPPVSTIDISEPSGLMRSWDVRAHWGGGTPQCSAITRRDYPGRSRFPAWFLNIVHNTEAPQHEIDLSMHGVVTVAEPGALAFDVAPAAGATLTVGEHVLAAEQGALRTTLLPGSHHVELRARLTGDDWRVVPSWNDRSLWSSALVTIAQPWPADRVLGSIAAMLTPALVLALLGCWCFTVVRRAPVDRVSLLSVGGAAVGAAILASVPATARFAALAIGLTLFAPAARGQVRARTALWLIGVPWLAAAAVLTAPRLGEFMLYTRGDDWLTYQVSAYRIYLQGHWLEAGEQLFYYQPLYRWIAGALHIVFGDSSAAETFWDGACLSAGAMLAFVVCRTWVSGRAALAAAVMTLAVFTLTPIWYLIGRGLAEISAAGFAWTSALLLIRARRATVTNALAAGICGVLAFYARLNQMLFAGALVVFLLPPEMPSRALRTPRRMLASIRMRHAVAYAGVLILGVALFSLRSWFYTGHLNPFAGTSFGLNHTGLAPDTVLSAAVWQRVSHSVFTQMMVNEVIDARGFIVFGGCLAAMLAVLQIPGFNRLPLALSLAVLGGLAGALVAHAHGYPGRFAVHVVPLATSLAMIAAVSATRARRGSESATLARAQPLPR